VAAAVVLTAGAVLGGTTASGATSGQLTAVPSAQPKQAGITSGNVLSPELVEIERARGSLPLENPDTATGITHYGYLGNGPMLPAPGDLPAADHLVEATKTEPDKNTYLVLDNQTGADPAYDYGEHFLFQGHEGGSPGYLTRVNLDADAAHRVTLLADKDVAGNPLPIRIDGSTWDPFAERLLFTSEQSGTTGGVWQATLDVPSQVDDISGALGRGGYEGIQSDDKGNLIIIEDIGGSRGTVNTHARQPNSFVYRFVPTDPADLTAGVLQVLQVDSLANPGSPITFHPGAADADILSQDMRDLHTYGNTFPARWVTIHDTAVDGTTPFDAGAAAKAKGGTPFKRPENGLFQPGSRFRTFFFSETGDTDNGTEAGSQFGGFGGVMQLSLDRSGDAVSLTPFFVGDPAHTGFDNVAFFGRDQLAFVEDAGDTLHSQRNALDSAYMFDTDLDYSNQANVPLRFIAQGRDPSATVDSGFLGMTGFQNDGDNELTGIHVSDGDPSARGILGAKVPNLASPHWRAFYTQQHGDNQTWELVRAR
jgi:hypothetical protein